MFILMLPVEKSKVKSSIRGYWLDNKIIYYDYLKEIKLPYIDKKALNGYSITYKQLALFYKQNKKSFIYTDKTKKTEVLSKVKRVSHTGYKGLKKAIKLFISNYGGCTVYIKKNSYLLECFYN